MYGREDNGCIAKDADDSERRTTTGAERSATDDVYRMQSNPGNGSTGCRQELGSGSGRIPDE